MVWHIDTKQAPHHDPVNGLSGKIWTKPNGPEVGVRFFVYRSMEIWTQNKEIVRNF